MRKFALSAVGKFMIDFDSTLSVKDAEQILMDFITHHHYKIIRDSIKNGKVDVKVGED